MDDDGWCAVYVDTTAQDSITVEPVSVVDTVLMTTATSSARIHRKDTTMGRSDEEGFGNETAQQMYYGTVRFYRDYGTPQQLAGYTAGGPPPPEPADGIIGKNLWHEHHRATVEELTAILEQMRREGIVTDTGPRAYTGPIPPTEITDLKAHMIEHQRCLTETVQPASSCDAGR